MVYPKVHFIHPALQRLLPQYRLIRDALGGETHVKAQRTLYLPYPSNEKCKVEKESRYHDYITRANYYNLTRRTLNGLVGQVFMKEPVIKLPSELKGVEEDANGAGVSLVQQAKKAESLTLAYSRCGLFVDHPATEDGVVTRSQLDQEFIRPTLYVYHAEEIVNWRIVETGARDMLSLVALYETYPFGDDGFELKTAEQYRVLRLDENGHYFQEVWREAQPEVDKKTDPFSHRRELGNSYSYNQPMWEMSEKFYPTDAQGNYFKEIPFTFVGSENNDPNPDHPNFYDLASLNIAHYRNSADYEEGVFISGQPTLLISGLTQDWLDSVLGNEIKVGSRGGIPLPSGGTGKLLQPLGEMAALAAMEHKEKQMVALGAKLVEQSKVERTAYEVKLEATADGSVLSNVTKNVAAAFTKALGWCAQFVGSTGTIEFKLNTEYDLVRMNKDEHQQVIASWMEGALSFKEMRDVLRDANLASEPDEKVLVEHQNRKERDIEMQRQQFAAANANPKEEGDVNEEEDQ